MEDWYDENYLYKFEWDSTKGIDFLKLAAFEKDLPLLISKVANSAVNFLDQFSTFWHLDRNPETAKIVNFSFTKSLENR